MWGHSSRILNKDCSDLSELEGRVKLENIHQSHSEKFQELHSQSPKLSYQRGENSANIQKEVVQIPRDSSQDDARLSRFCNRQVGT